MPNKDKESTCVLTLPLIVERWQADRIDHRLEAGRLMYNALVGVMLKRYYKLLHDSEYKEIMQRLNEDNKNKELWRRRAELLKKWGFRLRAKAGLSSFESEIDPMRKHFICIQAQTGHKIAASAYRAFEKLLNGNGKKIRFKRKGEFNSLEGKSNKSDIRYNEGTVKWNGLLLKVKLDGNNIYESEMLNKPIKYCRILRQTIRGRKRYYVQLSLEGVPAVKRKREDGSFSRTVGKSRVGLDIGTKTLAICSEKCVELIELADRIGDIESEKRRIQRKMDRSRRLCNPNNYTIDGQVKRGIKLEWIKSNHYISLSDKLRELYRKQAAIRKYQHILLANHILEMGTEIYVEQMNFSALQRRACKTEKNAKGRFKRKKRFGKSLANKAPSMFLTILDNKLKALNGRGLYKVDKWEFKASQYDHLSKTYSKKSLSKRIHILENGDIIQRDLYSAFLIMNCSDDLKSPDTGRCKGSYDQFKTMHDNYMKLLFRSDKLMPSSMGVNQLKEAGANF